MPAAKLKVELTHTTSLAVDRLRAHVGYLADDALEGRGPATEGIHKAADYLQKELQAIGLQPAFAGGFKQPFEMNVRTSVGPKNKITQGGALKLGEDFEPFAFSKTGKVQAELVFGGFGIKAPEHKYDDYAQIKPSGKILVLLSGEPGEDDKDSPFDGRKMTRHAALRRKVLLAREAGAKAVLIIRKKQLKRRKYTDPVSDAGIIAVKISAGAAKKLLGFDPQDVQKKIDKTHQPQPAAVKRPKVMVQTDLVRERRTVHNVGGLLKIPGATEAVIIGAHYDHLGYGGADSLSGSEKPQVHNGADDNASGTAVVVEVARALAKSPGPGKLKRNVYFLLFAGEEDGLLGSNHFAKNSPVPMNTVATMINLDMVGRMRNNKMNVMGTKTAPEFRELAGRVVMKHKLSSSFGGDGYGPSDHTSFYAAGVPVMFLFTGAHSNYHKPSDDADTLNYQGMARVGAVAGDLLRALGTAEARPTYVKAPPPKPTGGGRGYGPYFGSIPDFGEQENGVLFAGVREGSPAAKVGVKKGDVLVKFGGFTIKNLQDFTQALRGCAPGDVVDFEIMRGKERLKLKTTLGKRE